MDGRQRFFWRSLCNLLTEGRLAYEERVSEGSRLDLSGSGLVPNEGLDGNLSCRGRHVGFIDGYYCGRHVCFCATLVQLGPLLPVPVQGWES